MFVGIGCFVRFWAQREAKQFIACRCVPVCVAGKRWSLPEALANAICFRDPWMHRTQKRHVLHVWNLYNPSELTKYILHE